MDEIICPKCGGQTTGELTPNSVHYGRVSCVNCGFIKFIPKPENQNIRRTTTKCSINLLECNICGRFLTELGVREVIEPHHLKPLSEGGADEEVNLIAACSACHKLIHWLRLYLGEHLRQKANGAPNATN